MIYKPTYRFTELVQLLTSDLSDENHERLSSIVRDEKERYSLVELNSLQSLIEFVAKTEGLKFELELFEMKYGKNN